LSKQMSFQAPLENGQLRCRNDVSKQVVPDAWCNSAEGAVADHS